MSIGSRLSFFFAGHGLDEPPGLFFTCSKEWVQVFEMYMQFETDEASNPLSEAKIIGDMNESGRALEVLFEACENAKVLTRLASEK